MLSEFGFVFVLKEKMVLVVIRGYILFELVLLVC